MPDGTTVLTPVTWPVGARIQLLQVPWDSNYRDVVVFDTADERAEWFAGQESVSWITKEGSYFRPLEPVRVPVPYSSAYKYNYAVVTNPVVPVTDEGPQRTLYYFVTYVKYVNPQVCELTLMLDLVMTYQDGVKLGNMFVESGHMGMSNSNLPDVSTNITGQQLREYLDVDEGLNVGSEYAVAWHDWQPFFGDEETGDFTPGYVCIVSTIDLTTNPGDISSPNLNVATGAPADSLPQGCDVYLIEYRATHDFMTALSQYSWVAQGIVSISCFPKKFVSLGESVSFLGNGLIDMWRMGDSMFSNKESYESPFYTTGNVFSILEKGFMTDDEHSGGTRADSRLAKLFCYPYSVIEVSAYNGSSVFIKPQLLRGNTLALMSVCCAVAPFARVGLTPKDYNCAINAVSDYVYHIDQNPYGTATASGSVQGIIAPGDFLDTALWVTSFPQFSIVNNNYITYMASTANTRNYQYQSAGWTLNKSLAGANVANQLAQAQIATQQSNYNNSLEGLIGNVLSSAGSTIDQMAGSNIPILSNVASGTMQQLMAYTGATGANWSSLGNVASNVTGLTQFQNEQALARQTAATNLGYAEYAANGDYQNTVRGIDAAYQDAALTPPSTVGQSGGDGFNWKNGLVGVDIKYKVITGAARKSVVNFFERYGYKINRWHDFGGAAMKALKVMSKFSYWKVQETYITCATANESEKDAIRGILEKGVTVWGTPEDIGNTGLRDNNTLRNISY